MPRQTASPPGGQNVWQAIIEMPAQSSMSRTFGEFVRKYVGFRSSVDRLAIEDERQDGRRSKAHKHQKEASGG
jgi:hypothetical protein